LCSPSSLVPPALGFRPCWSPNEHRSGNGRLSPPSEHLNKHGLSPLGGLFPKEFFAGRWPTPRLRGHLRAARSSAYGDFWRVIRRWGRIDSCVAHRPLLYYHAGELFVLCSGGAVAE
jgi:hypothetical protein